MTESRGNTKIIILGLILIAGIFMGWQWWQSRQSALPEGIVSGNGRIEAVQIKVATKYPGRVDTINAEEGDMVKLGQILAVMDSAELQAALTGAEAQFARAEEAVLEAESAITMRESTLKLAEQELERALPLAARGSLSQREAEQHQSARDSAYAAVVMAKAHHRTAQKAVEATNATVQQAKAQLSECTLSATVNGRVLYRLAEPGEVVGAGGNVLTILDMDNIYMEIFIPSAAASRLAIGTEARIILDALPEYVIPAHVSFVSPEAQYTPKQVETQSERDKLMFRIKIRIPSEVVAPHMEKVKTGIRGVAYVRFDDTVVWPEHLKSRLPGEI